jgi:hypothetical protein
MTQRLRFEDLMGKVVRNSHGRPVCRIEDARMEPDGEDYIITHFLVGSLSWVSRIRAFLGELPTLRAIGIGHERDLRPFPWQWFDFSDPDRPVLTTESSAA